MPTLDEQYNQTVEAQKNYLIQLQNAFNQHCSEITEQSKLKLSQIPESDTESRKIVAEEQKQKLSEALQQFKTEVNLSSGNTRKTLEKIHSEREALKLQELEKVISKT